jgi:nitroreductase
MTAAPDREAPADHPIEAIFRRRWSPRSFTGAPISQAQLHSLLEAARWAASSNNLQPWHFIVARRDAEAEAFAKLVGVLNPNNQAWAQNAAVLMIAVARTDNPTNGNPSRTALYDTGAAAAQLCLQAAALGLQAHQMAGFDVAKAREVFGIPANFEPGAAIAVGHVGPASALPEALAQRETAPRTRHPISAFAHHGAWRKD